MLAKTAHYFSSYITIGQERKVAQLPTDSKQRKNLPLARGLLDYFPSALAAVANLSRLGNDKHNPGEEMHHARGKSVDHADCILRHLVDRGTIDPEDGILHDVKVAWRALAMLQEKLEELGAPLARGARLPEDAARELTQLDQDRYMVPVVTRIYDECENNIHERIAGDSDAAQRIKNKYYFGDEGK